MQASARPGDSGRALCRCREERHGRAVVSGRPPPVVGDRRRPRDARVMAPLHCSPRRLPSLLPSPEHAGAAPGTGGEDGMPGPSGFAAKDQRAPAVLSRAVPYAAQGLGAARHGHRAASSARAPASRTDLRRREAVLLQGVRVGPVQGQRTDARLSTGSPAHSGRGPATEPPLGGDGTAPSAKLLSGALSLSYRFGSGLRRSHLARGGFLQYGCDRGAVHEGGG